MKEDRSSGYEDVAAEFLAGRGSTRSVGIGVATVRSWAGRLPAGATVLDVGCGPGFPMTSVLIDEGLAVWGVDVAPTFVAAFEQRFPGVPVACEAVEESSFFGRRFDAVFSWGLMFLLPPDAQRALIRRFAGILEPGGRLLFTSPPQPITWHDAMTGEESRSLGAEEYRRLLKAARLAVWDEYEDEGENHYYDAVRGG